jgi:hypothetical protein
MADADDAHIGQLVSGVLRDLISLQASPPWFQQLGVGCLQNPQQVCVAVWFRGRINCSRLLFDEEKVSLSTTCPLHAGGVPEASILA